MLRWREFARVASATAGRWSSAFRVHALQLRNDFRQTRFRDIAREFTPRRLWGDFRQSSVRTQALCALTAYGLAATGMMYAYIRYTQAKRREQWGIVLRSWE
eukprot:TRINITY_DN84368_c0_g1_i1.p1 TRINITY_DN84368_c0_g1~~TRINITY_DN84368_c0_g1_i1.p1  ORF type:complete len:117 (+),score=9.51 TRINITY_DN84368_c0_g1_i1:48-353(+)